MHFQWFCNCKLSDFSQPRRVKPCVCVCVSLRVCMRALKQSVLCSNSLCSYCNLTIILHVWMCVFVTVYTCVNIQSIDMLL